jgi:hypothetical protein
MTSFPREVAEAALAHAVGDETELAYRRSDALAKTAQTHGGLGKVLHGKISELVPLAWTFRNV